jgi:pSer/pThr/pTyr-binding forkhead associated (FHA) protein
VKLRLLCRDPLAPQPEILIESFPVVLGRGAEASVRIDDRWLSRRHCRLEIAGGTVQVRDLGSRHGTYVNGQLVRECQLLPGDELCIGLTHYVAKYEPEFAHADA